MAASAASWSRVNNLAFGIGVRRYSHGTDRHLWKLEVTRHCGDVALEVEVTERDLRETARLLRGMADMLAPQPAADPA